MTQWILVMCFVTLLVLIPARMYEDADALDTRDDGDDDDDDDDKYAEDPRDFYDNSAMVPKLGGKRITATELPPRRSSLPKPMTPDLWKDTRREFRVPNAQSSSIAADTLSYQGREMRSNNGHSFDMVADLTFLKGEILHIKRQAHVIWENVTDTRRDHKRMNKTLWWVLKNVTLLLDEVERSTDMFTIMQRDYGTINDRLDNAVDKVAHAPEFLGVLREMNSEFIQIRSTMTDGTGMVTEELYLIREIVSQMAPVLLDVKDYVIDGFRNIGRDCGNKQFGASSNTSVVCSNLVDQTAAINVINVNVRDIAHVVSELAGRINSLDATAITMANHVMNSHNEVETVNDRVAGVQVRTDEVSEQLYTLVMHIDGIASNLNHQFHNVMVDLTAVKLELQELKQASRQRNRVDGIVNAAGDNGTEVTESVETQKRADFPSSDSSETSGPDAPTYDDPHSNTVDNQTSSEGPTSAPHPSHPHGRQPYSSSYPPHLPYPTPPSYTLGPGVPQNPAYPNQAYPIPAVAYIYPSLPMPAPTYPNTAYPYAPGYPPNFPTIPTCPPQDAYSRYLLGTVGMDQDSLAEYPPGPQGPGLPIGEGPEFTGRCACVCPCRCTCPTALEEDPNIFKARNAKNSSTIRQYRLKGKCHCPCLCPCGTPGLPPLFPGATPDHTPGWPPYATGLPSPYPPPIWPSQPSGTFYSNLFENLIGRYTLIREHLDRLGIALKLEHEATRDVVRNGMDSGFKDFVNDLVEYFENNVIIDWDNLDLGWGNVMILMQAVGGVNDALNNMGIDVYKLMQKNFVPLAMHLLRFRSASPVLHSYATMLLSRAREPSAGPTDQTNRGKISGRPLNQPIDGRPTVTGLGRPQGSLGVQYPLNDPSVGRAPGKPLMSSLGKYPGSSGAVSSLEDHPSRLAGSNNSGTLHSGVIGEESLAVRPLAALVDRTSPATTALQQLSIDGTPKDQSFALPQGEIGDSPDDAVSFRKGISWRSPRTKLDNTGNTFPMLSTRSAAGRRMIPLYDEGKETTTAATESSDKKEESRERCTNEKYRDAERVLSETGGTSDKPSTESVQASPQDVDGMLNKVTGMPKTELVLPAEDVRVIEAPIDPLAFHSLLQKHINAQIINAVPPDLIQRTMVNPFSLDHWHGQPPDPIEFQQRPMFPVIPGFPVARQPARPGPPISPMGFQNPFAMRPWPLSVPSAIEHLPPGMMVAGSSGLPYSFAYNDGRGNSWNVNVNRRNLPGAKEEQDQQPEPVVETDVTTEEITAEEKNERDDKE